MKRASENKGTHTVSSKKASFAEQKYDFKNKKFYVLTEKINAFILPCRNKKL